MGPLFVILYDAVIMQLVADAIWSSRLQNDPVKINGREEKRNDLQEAISIIALPVMCMYELVEKTCWEFLFPLEVGIKFY